MVTVPRQLIGSAYEDSQTWSVLESLTDIGNRMAGQTGEAEGAEFIQTTFDTLGFREVQRTEFSVPGWWREDSSLSVTADRERTFDRDHELIALPGSPAATVTGPIVDVGAGIPEDFEDVDVTGSLVLTSIKTPEEYSRWVHRAEKYGRAVDGGAAGFLFYNEIPGCLPPTGTIGGNGPGEIPAVGLSLEVGRRLVRACFKGNPEGSLKVDAESGPSTSQNVEAVIGPDAEQEILLTAHVDAHDITEGATDNGVGCALVTEVGRLIDRYADDLDTGIRLLIFGSEEIGLRGAHHWIEAHDADRVKCIVNIDGNGTWEDVTVYTHGYETLSRGFKGAVDSFGSSMTVNDGYLPHSDHWPFVQRGVPGVMIRSESTTGRGWGHTHGDTLDKLDPKPLRELAIGISAGILNLADHGLEIVPHDIEQIQNDLLAAGHADGMKAADDWPFQDG